jgi:hypothetical protein
MTLYSVTQTATRFARSPVSAWAGRNAIDRGKRYISEDAAFTDICERLAEVSSLVRIDPQPEATRRESGTVVVRSDPLGLVFYVCERSRK